jgi:hypothetical protein|tara:strand:- start:2208 stop:2411 length:204 start_codon:yes stop_codon:yes gene_type:complete
MEHACEEVKQNPNTLRIKKTSIAAQFTETTSIPKLNTATARKELSLRRKLSLLNVEIEPASETAPNP